MSDPTKLESRVIRAAEAALADHQFVSAIDIYTGMGLLAPSNVTAWRQGRLDCLERMIQGNLTKLSRTMELFRQWAADQGLKPSESRYVRHTRGGTIDLQFSVSGDPGIERNYRTHYVSPELSERKKQQINASLDRAAEPVVFLILRDSQCSVCGAELARGSFLVVEGEHALCLPCAGLGHLVYLPSGNATLTRRATRYSERSRVVVRFSRARGRYERQGILVEKPALEKAQRAASSS
jgi:hypothetical protein